MKAKNRINRILFGAAVFLFAEGIQAQSCAPSQGAGFRLPAQPSVSETKTNPEKVAPLNPQNLLLPEWKAEDLPFFCRIEHKWGKNMGTKVKFRLGSVDYVDWLEGKSHFATFAP